MSGLDIVRESYDLWNVIVSSGPSQGVIVATKRRKKDAQAFIGEWDHLHFDCVHVSIDAALESGAPIVTIPAASLEALRDSRDKAIEDGAVYKKANFLLGSAAQVDATRKYIRGELELTREMIRDLINKHEYDLDGDT